MLIYQVLDGLAIGWPILNSNFWNTDCRVTVLELLGLFLMRPPLFLVAKKLKHFIKPFELLRQVLTPDTREWRINAESETISTFRMSS